MKSFWMDAILRCVCGARIPIWCYLKTKNSRLEFLVESTSLIKLIFVCLHNFEFFHDENRLRI